MPLSLLAGWLALSDQAFYQRAFTPLITLWYLVYQRLSAKHTLSQVVVDALNGGADRLSCRGKPLSSQLQSQATTSFSDARQRLPLGIVQRALRHIGSQLDTTLQAPRFRGLKLGGLDGSTLRLRPLGDIPQAFPPHRSGGCLKLPYWCVARVVGIFCLGTGMVIDTAMASPKHSEQNLCTRLFEQLWQGWLILADRNFGIYSVVAGARAAQAHLLVRLTRARAASLARRAGLVLRPGLNAPIAWRPTGRDHLPPGLEPKPIEGRLLAATVRRKGFPAMQLYLFTTLSDQTLGLQELVSLYARRWNVELYFRYLKTQMELEFLQCQSVQMAQKEWWAGLIAYDLIRWTMGAAAALHSVPLEQLSFSKAREFLLAWLGRWAEHRPTNPSWARLLVQLATARLPRRKRQRPSEPRAVRAFKRDVPILRGPRAQARLELAAAHAKS
jgi:DDE family transposase